METQRLRIAMQKSGRLSQDSQALFKSCGLKINLREQRLIAHVENMPIDILRVRDDDIPGLVMEGVVDLGIIGENVLEEVQLIRAAQGQPFAVKTLKQLDFGGCRLSLAVPDDVNYTGPESLADKRIATSYPGLLGAWLSERGINARLIKLDGAVESAVKLGVADAVADVVETGSTLKRAGLEMFGEPILISEAILIQPTGVDRPEGLDRLTRRLAGVMTARNYKMIDYNVAASNLERASAITPGIDSPTVSHLAREGWLAVRAMIPAKDAPTIMDELWNVGAEGILVTDIAACRL